MSQKSATKQIGAVVKKITKVKKDIFLLKISCPHIAKKAQPGEFLHVKLDEVILRRPLSIHNVTAKDVAILFKVRGRGTKALSLLKRGSVLDIIGPLGRGFQYAQRTAHSARHILVAGGIGVAPLVFLAQKLTRESCVVLLGAKNKNEIVCEKDFKKLGCKVFIATEDGSKGHKGTVTDLLRQQLSAADFRPPTTYIYACGPEAMFHTMQGVVKRYPKAHCQVSFEQFMGCGLGVCCACVIETKKGYKKVCKDGPVFELNSIW